MTDNASKKSASVKKTNEEEKSIKGEEGESNVSTPKKPFNPYELDIENPYNNMNDPPQEATEVDPNDLTVLCYHCKNPIKIQDDWRLFECSSCHRMNKLPRKLINELYFTEKLKNVRYNSYKNHLNMIVPLPFIIVVCPFCKAENKVENKVNYTVCFICGRSFNVDYTEENVKPFEKCSLNPNSKYYRFNTNKINRCYPPACCMRVPSRFFPEPINYDNNYYYQPGGFTNLNYNSFKWDNHNLKYYPPITPIIHDKKVDVKSLEPIAGSSLVKSISDINMKRENQRAELYKNIFFMK